MKTCTLLTWQLEIRLLKACGWYLTNCYVVSVVNEQQSESGSREEDCSR